jgi:hypothetical protein
LRQRSRRYRSVRAPSGPRASGHTNSLNQRYTDGITIEINGKSEIKMGNGKENPWDKMSSDLQKIFVATIPVLFQGTFMPVNTRFIIYLIIPTISLSICGYLIVRQKSRDGWKWRGIAKKKLGGACLALIWCLAFSDFFSIVYLTKGSLAGFFSWLSKSPVSNIVTAIDNHYYPGAFIFLAIIPIVYFLDAVQVLDIHAK